MVKAKEELSTLYHKGKSGAIYSWKVSAKGDTITTVYGQVNGLKTTTNKKVEQKNVGKKNETSLTEQAEKEAQAMWLFKRTRKYSETLEDAQEELELPMLAKEYDKCKKKVIFPVDVQPKLDGVRALAKWEGDEIVLTSRSGKPWIATSHINEALKKFLPKDSVFDGELYIHGATFQQITRLVKKNRPESIEVKYHIYDIPDNKGNSDLVWSERLKNLDNLRSEIAIAESIGKVQEYNFDIHLRIVSSTKANDHNDIKRIHDEYVKAGYEGAIVRLGEGRYIYGYRSEYLLKVKDFESDEFEIIGWESGTGRYENCAVFICKTTEDTEFKVNMKTSIEDKEEYLKNAKSYIGKMLTVRYFGKSEPPSSTPRFPVGIAIRLEEDMSKEN